MRVLIVSQYFWPEQFRVNEIGKILLQKGHIVEVLTGIPNYPEGKVFKEFLEDKKKFKNYLGVKIHRVPIIRRKNSSPVNLFINYLSFVLSAIIIGT